MKRGRHLNPPAEPAREPEKAGAAAESDRPVVVPPPPRTAPAPPGPGPAKCPPLSMICRAGNPKRFFPAATLLVALHEKT